MIAWLLGTWVSKSSFATSAVALSPKSTFLRHPHKLPHSPSLGISRSLYRLSGNAISPMTWSLHPHRLEIQPRSNRSGSSIKEVLSCSVPHRMGKRALTRSLFTEISASTARTLLSGHWVMDLFPSEYIFKYIRIMVKTLCALKQKRVSLA